jgi:hypothetical protein
VLAIGVTYKPGVDDQRGFPALAVMERLAAKGAVVVYHDPFIPDLLLDGTVLTSLPLTAEVMAAQDCVAILTAPVSGQHAPRRCGSAGVQRARRDDGHRRAECNPPLARPSGGDGRDHPSDHTVG